MLDAAVPKRFRLLRRLGEGGMGVVYEALDEERGVRVALKTVRNLTPTSLARFKQEFRALQDVHHPNLVALGELVSEAGEWFFTMELVLGGDFIDYIRPAAQASRTRVRSTGSTLSETLVSALAAEATPARAEVVHFDEARLRAALRQLALALVTLHAAGLVHRDIKPSNIRVSEEGRVVVLDFGLVADFTAARYSTETKVVGTPEYMAPEQAAGRAVGPEADWYSVGVLLYEALTGQLPFQGAPVLVLMQKQQQEAPVPSRVASGVPADLDLLCGALLAFDPQQRPLPETILEMFGGRTNSPETALGTGLTAPRAQQTPFVGRAAELETLRRAFHESRQRGAISFFVRGESGVGKSCLVRHFTESLSAEAPDALILSGRCYESESVPFKAFDGVVDALARFLSRLPPADAERFVPTRPQPLLRVFPVLKRVDAIARAPKEELTDLDPPTLRGRAFAILRELLTRVADRYPVVVVIRDIQWADADSLVMLADFLHPPDAPSLLLIGTVRSANADASYGGGDPRGDRLAAIGGDKRLLDLARMTDLEATELARKLLERTSPATSQDAAEIAREAEGHPLFIEAIVRYGALTGAPSASLEQAIGWRVDHLEQATRLILELVAVAGAPIAQSILAIAAGEESSSFARRVAALRIAHLVTVTGVRGSDTIEPYHDRVRTAVTARLSRPLLEMRHHSLAVACEQSDGIDPETLSLHWMRAGEKERGAKYAADAGDRAAEALAFDIAARLYESALASWPLGVERQVLEHKLGDVLAAAGRGARAAGAYQRAAEGAQATAAIELRRCAAEQLFRSGHFDQGLAAMTDVLASIGMTLPRGPVTALLALLVWRAIVRLRGVRCVLRDKAGLSAETLMRVDTCGSIAANLVVTDHIRGAAFQGRHLLLALRAGEAHRVSRALALEVVYRSAAGGDVLGRTRPLLDRLAAIGRELRHPLAVGWLQGATGFAHLHAGEFQAGLASFERAGDIWSTQCAGVAWEVDMVRMSELICLAHLGRLKELHRRTEEHLRDALERGDVFATVNSRIGIPTVRWLARDDPGACQRGVREAMGQWSKSGFHVAHYWELEALTNADLYAGEGRRAYDRIAMRWPELRRSLLLRFQIIRIFATLYRGRAALAAALAGKDRDALLGIAAHDARAVERERMPWSAPLAALLSAGIEATSKRDAVVVDYLRAASVGFGHAGMGLHVAISQRHLGRYVGGSEGERSCGPPMSGSRRRASRIRRRCPRCWRPACDGPVRRARSEPPPELRDPSARRRSHVHPRRGLALVPRPCAVGEERVDREPHRDDAHPERDVGRERFALHRVEVRRRAVGRARLAQVIQVPLRREPEHGEAGQAHDAHAPEDDRERGDGRLRRRGFLFLRRGGRSRRGGEV